MDILSIIPPVENLRPTDLESVEMSLLRDSISKVGLIQPITIGDGNVIIDGYRRWLVCRELGMTEIPVHKVSGDPADLRIIAQTRRHEFGRVEKKILVGNYLIKNPSATCGDIAHKFQWTISEVEQITGVIYLVDVLRQLYDDGKLPLSTVWHLSRLKEPRQLEAWEMSEHDIEVLHEIAQEMLRVDRGARRKRYCTRRLMRIIKEIRDELDNPTAGGPLLLKHKIERPIDAWNLAIKWVMNQI